MSEAAARRIAVQRGEASRRGAACCVRVGIRVGIVKVWKQKNSPSPESSVVRRSTKGLTDVQYSSGTRGQWPPSIGDSESGKGGDGWMDGRSRGTWLGFFQLG
jgi:hypothetical protein